MTKTQLLDFVNSLLDATFSFIMTQQPINVSFDSDSENEEPTPVTKPRR